jgi:hypothetical protein
LSRPRHAEWLLAAGSLASALVLLVGVELAYRRLAPEREITGDALAELHVYSEDYGWLPRPHFRGRVAGARTSVNADGYRGTRHAVERRPGRRRVLLLGDSITFGYRVSDEATFAAHLEAARPDLEVLNFGVEGYGTTQELLRLQRDGLRYRPDVVVLNVCIENDPVDNWRSANLYEEQHAQPYFRLEHDRLVLHATPLVLPTWRRLALALERRSLLFGRLVAPRPSAPPASTNVRWRLAKAQALKEREAVLALTKRLLLEAARSAQAAGAGFLLVLHPNKPALSGRASLLPDLRDAPELASLLRYDPGADYRALGLSASDVLLDGSGHLNPRGHALFAALLARRLSL